MATMAKKPRNAKNLDQCRIGDTGVVHPALKGYFTYRFYKLALRLREQVNEALEEIEIVGAQLGLLRVLAQEGPASQISLGRSLGIDKASMVKFLDGLERRGLLRRVSLEGDRRVKHIQITPKGLKTLEQGTRLREAVEKDFFAPLSAQERALMDVCLAKLVR
jgi:DNA-binding MarR family transcriptional regulator